MARNRTRAAALAASALILLTLAAPAPPARAESPRAGRILFAAARAADGNSDIFTADLGGEVAVNLTADPAPDVSPAWSPDGRTVAFASRRGGNWDIYTIGADGAGLRRLTDSPDYEGQPAFSPDGSRLAFAAMRDGNLDVYALDLATGAAARLTEDPASDYEPAWSPDGRALAFTSWRDGRRQVYAVDLSGAAPGEARNLSRGEGDDYGPAFSPDGRRIAFVSDRLGGAMLFTLDLASGAAAPAGPAGRTVGRPSWTPGGGLLAAGAWVAGGQRFSQRQGVLITAPDSAAATYIVGGPQAYADPSWSAAAAVPALPQERSSPGRLVGVAAVPGVASAAPAAPEREAGLRRLDGVRAGGQALLANDVYDSFVALREATVDATGHDFLARLSEATRAVDFRSDSASYTSWHKAGRAFDTLFDYAAGGRKVLYISPDPVAGRLFWRLYLRAARQDGSQGAPLTAPVFDPGSRTLSAPPRGYFVDFTELAAGYGWRRIAAQERDTFDWRRDLLALEYWHFERRDGLSWYQAMELVHSPATLERLFSLERMKAAGSRVELAPFLGLPWAAPPPQVTGPLVPLRGPR